MFAYLEFKATLCPHCGTREEDWLEDGRIKDDIKYAAVTKKCMGCAEMEMLRDNIPPDQKGVYVYLEQGNPHELQQRIAEMKVYKLYGTIDPENAFG